MNEENTNPSPVASNQEEQPTPVASPVDASVIPKPNQEQVTQPTQFNERGEPIQPAVPKLDPSFIQKPIRTFESDLAEALANNQGSVASIAIAESKRKEELLKKQMSQQSGPVTLNRAPGIIPQGVPIPGMVPPPQRSSPSQKTTPPIAPVVQPKSTTSSYQDVNPVELAPHHSIVKPLLFTLLSLLLIAGGIVIGIYIYGKSLEQKPIPIAETFDIPDLIPGDKQLTLVTGGLQGNQLIQKLYSELDKITLEKGKITKLVLYEKEDETPRGQVTGSNFISKFDMRIPDIIMRSLTDRFEFGAYTEETGEKTTFLALTTDFFQNAFAGMLMWEDTLPDDLALLLNYKTKALRLDPLATTTSYLGVRGTFSDKIIKNRDVRVFRKANGELLFLYSFINKETLLITTTESAFVNIIERIEKDIYVR